MQQRQAKLYHPDAGGDDWAFRILAQAYELLSSARVAHVSRAEYSGRPSNAGNGSGFGDGTAEPPAYEDETETVRPGVDDIAFDPNMVVEVEKLWIRSRPTDPWQLADGASDERFLSCRLNIAWPESSLAARARAIPAADAHLRKLVEIFEDLRALTPAVASSERVQDDRFVGWLSYASLNRASVAFRRLRESLHANGFRLKQWTRQTLRPLVRSISSIR